MLKIENNKYVKLSACVRFKENGEDKVVYTDSPSLYIQMCNNEKSRFSNPVMSETTLTEEQTKRLQEVNGLNIPADKLELCLQEADDYVRDGYFRPEPRAPFVEFAKTKEEQSKAWFLQYHTAELANIRWMKETSGAKYGEFIVASDESSISKITGTVVSFQAGVLQTTDFKFVNGWKTVDAKEMQLIAGAVSNHVDSCFKAENAVKEQLKGMTLKQLCPDTYMSQEDDGQKLDVKKLFDAEFDKIIGAKAAALKAAQA